MRPSRPRRQHLAATSVRRPLQALGRGFTLLELLIVMVIIGILLAFILSAAADSIRRGEERGTQALVAKLEAGITDRIEAVANLRIDANAAHNYMGQVYNTYPQLLPNIQRGYVIAQFDKLKAEFPDVFYVQSDSNYPFNFAAVGYPGNETAYVTSGYGQFLLPLGIGIQNDPAGNNGSTSYGGNTSIPITSDGTTVVPIFPNSTGIFGASYSVRGGFAKQLGSGPKGYDGVDNDGNGLIDEFNEWGITQNQLYPPPDPNYPNKPSLANHTHKTARAETLYAVLVEGVGPLGSVFEASDFNDREVADTDNDGLLEFVDAWGEPLQFYRWPIFYHGNDDPAAPYYTPTTQRGYLAYTSPLLPRDQNPLDPNQLLVSPDWWWSGFNNSDPGTVPYSVFSPSGPFSGGVVGFTQFFIPLADPWSNPSITTAPGYWDRGSVYSQRREFYSRFLLVSGGADRTPGTAVLSTEYFTKLDAIGSQENNYTTSILATTSEFTFPTGTIANDTAMALIESQGGTVTPFRSDNLYQTPLSLLGTAGHAEITRSMQLAGFDDITNHNLQAPGGATQ